MSNITKLNGAFLCALIVLASASHGARADEDDFFRQSVQTMRIVCDDYPEGAVCAAMKQSVLEQLPAARQRAQEGARIRQNEDEYWMTDCNNPVRLPGWCHR
jgi:hypothetical protein